MAKEWVKDAQNKARVETNLHAETSKALGTAEQKNQELATKLTAEERGRKSAKVGLKNAQDQAREQCKKLHYAEIELATVKQQVLDLKAELDKAKKVARATKATMKASKQRFYDLGMQESEAYLTKELARVCKEYCLEVWAKALNLARVPATSDWRRLKASTALKTSEKLLQHF